MPTPAPEPIAAAQAAGFDVLCGLTSKTLDGFQKVAELNLETMKWTLAETQECTRKAFDAKNAGDLLAMEAGFLSPVAEKVQAYGRQLFEIAATTRADFAKVAEVQYQESKRLMQDYIDAAAKGAPPGSEAAMVAWKSALTATASFFDAMQQAATQADEVTESNLNIGAAAASDADQQASTQAARAAKR
ncbi:TIGR01841 family phasin [Cupriavidus necator]